MMRLIGTLALIALLVWLFTGRRRLREPAPEDVIGEPIDRKLLAEAERELAEDDAPRPLVDGFDDDEDDWGPGAG